jgi:hypothetical protein
MAVLFIPESVSMFLLGIGLVSLAWFARIFLKKRRHTQTPLSDSLNRLRLRDGLKLKLEIIQKKVERLILESKELLSAKETVDNTDRDGRSDIERRQFIHNDIFLKED